MANDPDQQGQIFGNPMSFQEAQDKPEYNHVNIYDQVLCLITDFACYRKKEGGEYLSTLPFFFAQELSKHRSAKRQSQSIHMGASEGLSQLSFLDDCFHRAIIAGLFCLALLWTTARPSSPL